MNRFKLVGYAFGAAQFLACLTHPALAADVPQVPYNDTWFETHDLGFTEENPLVLTGEGVNLLDVGDSGEVHQIAAVFFRGEAELQSGKVQVTINQKDFGTYTFPLRDPPYWIRLNPTASNKIGFRLTQGKLVKLTQILVVRSIKRFEEEEIKELPQPEPFEMDRCLDKYTRRHCLFSTIQKIFKVSDALNGFIDRETYDRYFPAIIAANTDLQATILGNQVDSKKTVEKISSLLLQLKAVEEYALKVAGGQHKLRSQMQTLLESYYGLVTLKLRIEIAIN